MAIFSLGLYIIVSFCISYSVSRFTHFLRIYLQIKSHVKVPGVRIPMYLLSGCNSVLLRIQFKPFKIRLYGERKKKKTFKFYTPRAKDGEDNGTPLQYSCRENPMGRGAWWAAVHGVEKSWTWLSDFTFTFHFHTLEKEMAAHSSILAWRIPGTVEPGGLPSMGSHRIRHDWSDLAAAAAVAAEPRKDNLTLRSL